MRQGRLKQLSVICMRGRENCLLTEALHIAVDTRLDGVCFYGNRASSDVIDYLLNARYTVSNRLLMLHDSQGQICAVTIPRIL